MRSTASGKFFIALTIFGLSGCDRAPEPDAYGNVEATELLVGAEAAGRIEQLRVVEGARLSAGTVVGSIEATRSRLEVSQVEAQRAAQAARVDELREQIEALEVQRSIARRAWERTRRLYEQQAATAQQLDQAERELRTHEEEIEVVRARMRTLQREVEAIDARVAQVEETVSDTRIRNPITGTVLAVYAHAGELAQMGQPLYAIANLDVVEVRAWVGQTQLAGLEPGQRVQVTIDAGAEQRVTRAGTLTWISPQAEFTPTPIQTREERAGLVYAITIRIGNRDRLLKIGMPVDVRFTGSRDRDV